MTEQSTNDRQRQPRRRQRARVCVPEIVQSRAVEVGGLPQRNPSGVDVLAMSAATGGKNPFRVIPRVRAHLS